MPDPISVCRLTKQRQLVLKKIFVQSSNYPHQFNLDSSLSPLLSSVVSLYYPDINLQHTLPNRCGLARCGGLMCYQPDAITDKYRGHSCKASALSTQDTTAAWRWQGESGTCACVSVWLKTVPSGGCVNVWGPAYCFSSRPASLSMQVPAPVFLVPESAWRQLSSQLP